MHCALRARDYQTILIGRRDRETSFIVGQRYLHGANGSLAVLAIRRDCIPRTSLQVKGKKAMNGNSASY